MGLPKKNVCPLIKAECMEHQCRWWIHTVGQTQDGAKVDQFGCAVEFIPLLLVENANQQRQTGAAIESFRNETIKVNQIPLLLGAAKRGLLEKGD